MTDETTVEEPEAPAATETPETPPEAETVTMPRQEADALRRKLAEAERDRRKLENDQRKAEEKRQEEQGQYQELAEQRQRELEQERSERGRIEREARITRLAGRLKFLDPIDVIGRITADEGADDSAAESALARIAESSPHLIAKDPPAAPTIGEVHSAATPAPGTPGARPAPPPGKAPLVTTADVEALSDKEFDARFAEVQAVLNNPQ